MYLADELIIEPQGAIHGIISGNSIMSFLGLRQCLIVDLSGYRVYIFPLVNTSFHSLYLVFRIRKKVETNPFTVLTVSVPAKSQCKFKCLHKERSPDHIVIV